MIPYPLESIAAWRVDRRLSQRYALDFPADYKLLRRGSVECQGSGHTLNIASGGVLLATDSLVGFPLGSHIALAIRWPVLLDGRCPLKLVMRGRIVRRTGKCIAVHANQYEFRTGRRTQPVEVFANASV